MRARVAVSCALVALLLVSASGCLAVDEPPYARAETEWKWRGEDKDGSLSVLVSETDEHLALYAEAGYEYGLRPDFDHARVWLLQRSGIEVAPVRGQTSECGSHWWVWQASYEFAPFPLSEIAAVRVEIDGESRTLPLGPIIRHY